MSHIYGTGSNIQAHIYPVTAEWSSSTVKWSDIENNFDTQQLLGEVNIAWADSVPDSGRVVEAAIKPEIVNRWISSSDENYGMALVTEQSDFMAEFYSVDASSGWATLTVVHKNTDDTQDTTVISNYIRDASLLINNNSEAMNQLITDQNSLVVGDISGYRSLIQFDLSDVPERITLHQAYLILQVQKEKSDARDFGLPLEFCMVSGDSSWDVAQLAIDSTRTNPATIALASADSTELTNSDNIYYFTQIVKSWLGDKSKNQGLLLSSTYKGAFLSEVYFYSAYADSQYAPILRLTYSEPPAGRFETQ
jgi:hypothetical protein